MDLGDFMNWDTNETFLWIVNTESFFFQLKEVIGNELHFLYRLYIIIKAINKTLASENEINISNVNGNEVYVRFSQAVGNEQEGWK